MSVATPNDEYKEYAPLWKKSRDAVAGSEQIKKCGTDYLPRLEGSDNTAYEAYKHRAMFYSASGRTVAGLAGAIIRKPADIVWPEAKRDTLQVIGHSAQSLETLIKEAVTEVLTVGRVGYLVDAPEDGSGNAYICTYFAENVVNWRIGVVNGRRQLIMVVLRECEHKPNEKDPFVTDEIVMYRVLYLGMREASDTAPYYFQQLWQEKIVKNPLTQAEEKEYELIKTSTPTMKAGKTFDVIPFTFVNPSNVLACPERPPLLDLFNVNISHYQNSADLEHGRHYTALPTPWVAGFDPKTTTLKIGSGVAWVSTDPNAQCGMLEFTGAGLSALADGMKSKENLMAVLGARLLEDQKEGVEAAETVRLRHAGEQAGLSNISITVSEAFTQLMRWVYQWANPMWKAPVKETSGDDAKKDDIRVDLNRDFNIVGINAPMLEKLMIALQSGAISWKTWCYNLSRGEVMPDGVSAEEEAENINEGLPAGMGSIFNEFQGDPNAPAHSGGKGTGKTGADGTKSLGGAGK